MERGGPLRSFRVTLYEGDETTETGCSLDTYCNLGVEAENEIIWDDAGFDLRGRIVTCDSPTIWTVRPRHREIFGEQHAPPHLVVVPPTGTDPDAPLVGATFSLRTMCAHGYVTVLDEATRDVVTGNLSALTVKELRPGTGTLAAEYPGPDMKLGPHYKIASTKQEGSIYFEPSVSADGYWTRRLGFDGLFSGGFDVRYKMQFCFAPWKVRRAVQLLVHNEKFHRLVYTFKMPLPKTNQFSFPAYARLDTYFAYDPTATANLVAYFRYPFKADLFRDFVAEWRTLDAEFVRGEPIIRFNVRLSATLFFAYGSDQSRRLERPNLFKISQEYVEMHKRLCALAADETLAKCFESTFGMDLKSFCDQGASSDAGRMVGRWLESKDELSHTDPDFLRNAFEAQTVGGSKCQWPAQLRSSAIAAAIDDTPEGAGRSRDEDGRPPSKRLRRSGADDSHATEVGRSAAPLGSTGSDAFAPLRYIPLLILYLLYPVLFERP